MDISFSVIQYLRFRAESCSLLELYIVDQITPNKFEIVFKDNGEKLNPEAEQRGNQIFQVIPEAIPTKITTYFHKGFNNLQLELVMAKSNPIEYKNLGQLMSVIILENREKEIVFTLLKRKGEFTLNSQALLNNFSDDELQSDDFLIYLTELLEQQIELLGN